MGTKKKSRFAKKCRIKGSINPDGSEIVDGKPTKLHATIQAPATLRQKMRQYWQEFREREIHDNSYETLQDAEDFDIDNDAPSRS